MFLLLLWIILKKETKNAWKYCFGNYTFAGKPPCFNSLMLKHYEYLSVSLSVPLYFSYS